jgi:hypothetical protein
MAKTKQQTARELNWAKYLILGMERKIFSLLPLSVVFSSRTIAQFEKAFDSLRRDIRRAEREAGIISRRDW